MLSEPDVQTLLSDSYKLKQIIVVRAGKRSTVRRHEGWKCEVQGVR